MKLKAESGGGDFLQQPAGKIVAVCCDIVDVGVKDTKWGPKNKIDLRFQSATVITAEDFTKQGQELTDERRKAVGEPWLYSSRYTASLSCAKGKESGLTLALRDMGLEIQEGVEYSICEPGPNSLDDQAIGKPVLLTVEAIEIEGRDKPFMAVQRIESLPKFNPETGQALESPIVSPNYQRVRDRQAEATSFPHGANVQQTVPEGAG